MHCCFFIFVILSYHNACYKCENVENQTWSDLFFNYGQKFQRQCVNVIDTTSGRIYFLKCGDFGREFQTQCAMTFNLGIALIIMFTKLAIVHVLLNFKPPLVYTWAIYESVKFLKNSKKIFSLKKSALFSLYIWFHQLNISLYLTSFMISVCTISFKNFNI